jgi:hypothetical protein
MCEKREGEYYGAIFALELTGVMRKEDTQQTPTSLYPDAAQAAGISFEALVTHLVERAWSRAT